MNIYGNITKYFIQNKKLSFLIIIGILLWGMISFILMPKQYNPDIVAPAFLVNVDFPGATVDEVYHLVTKPAEDVLNELPGVENIYSQSYHGGKSSIVVEFYVGEDLEESMIALRQKISSRINLSPLGALEPYIASIDPEDLPIQTLALTSNKVSSLDLRKIAFQLKDELKQIKGTSLVEIVGGRKREIKILLDIEKMKETDTTLNEIAIALERTSLLKDLGTIKTKDKYFHIETQEQALTVKDIENIVIISNIERNLFVKDVAKVILDEEEIESYSHLKKKEGPLKDAVFIAISKQKGQNIINVSKNIKKRLAELEGTKEYLKNVDVNLVKDEGRVADEEISGLINNLIQAICIVFIVLLFFLNIRAALIVAFAIPITLLTVLALGNAFGYTLNRITLFALILSLGLLVDSATVVIENIVRNKKMYPKEPKEKLVPNSVSEVGAGLFLSTLTTVLAFIPMLFVTGMMGPYMGPIPFFVSAALIVSLVFAYTLNPWLAYIFCQDKVISDISKNCGILCQASKKTLYGYQRILSTLLSERKVRIKFLLISVLILCVVMVFPVVKLLRFRMLPKADREQIYVYIDLDSGTSIERSQIVADKAIGVVHANEHVKSVQSFIGIPPVLDFNGMFRGVMDRQGTNQITLKVNLTHSDKRASASEDVAITFREQLITKLYEFNDAKIKIVEDPPGPPVRSTFYVKLKSTNPKLLYNVADDLDSKIKLIDEVKDVDVSYLEPNNKYVITIDKQAVARAKVSVDSISRELQTVFSGRIIGVYHSDYNLEQEYIVLRLPRDLRDGIGDLDKIFITNALGNHLSLARFVKIREATQEDIITNDNRERAIYLSGEMGKRSVTYAAIDLLGILHKYKVPQQQTKLTKFSLFGAEYEVGEGDKLKIEIGGEWDLTLDVFRDLGLAMLVAIVFIYLVLVAQFKSFRMPILILGTIPLAMIGVIPGFAFLFATMGVYFSATSMIGVIALAGIVVNNAIIFIEYVQQIAKEKATLKDALIDAGLTRMRPILLTSITTILGSLVIASDPVWSGLAWAIVFGLSLSSLLTLIVFPVLVYEFLGEKWFKTA